MFFLLKGAQGQFRLGDAYHASFPAVPERRPGQAIPPNPLDRVTAEIVNALSTPLAQFKSPSEWIDRSPGRLSPGPNTDAAELRYADEAYRYSVAEALRSIPMENARPFLRAMLHSADPLTVLWWPRPNSTREMTKASLSSCLTC